MTTIAGIARALRKLATLLAPNGRIAISLRLGESDAARAMHGRRGQVR